MMRALDALVAVVTVAVLAGALFAMLVLEASSRSQGGRFYVAVAALVLLGVIFSQVGRFMDIRRRPYASPTALERRFALLSLIVMVCSTVVLIGLAWLLP
jgi:hypothetical protein